MRKTPNEVYFSLRTPNLYISRLWAYVNDTEVESPVRITDESGDWTVSKLFWNSKRQKYDIVYYST